MTRQKLLSEIKYALNYIEYDEKEEKEIKESFEKLKKDLKLFKIVKREYNKEFGRKLKLKSENSSSFKDTLDGLNFTANFIAIENATLSSALEILIDTLGIAEIFQSYNAGGYIEVGESLYRLEKSKFEIIKDAFEIIRGDK